jgi:hypothetical protein
LLTERQTEVVFKAMKAYFEILKSKQYRSPEEISIFDGLLEVLDCIKYEVHKEGANIEQPREQQTYEDQTTPNECD